MTREMLIAHITDLHYPVYTAFEMKDLLSKRITGGLNLLFSSRRRFRTHYLGHLLMNLRRIDVDHVMVTGDLVNLGYADEFDAVRQALDAAGYTPEQVSCVPGNHDVYLPSALEHRHFWEELGGYAVVDGPSKYPFVRDLGGMLLIGLSSAVPSGFGLAYGRLGEAQLARLEQILADTAGTPRMLMLHHPPLVGNDSFDDGLLDGAGLRHLLWKYGVDLVLHGHEHHDLTGTVPGPSGAQIPVLGTGCAILDHPGHGDHARARLIRLTDGRLDHSWVISYNRKTGHWHPV